MSVQWPKLVCVPIMRSIWVTAEWSLLEWSMVTRQQPDNWDHAQTAPGGSSWQPWTRWIASQRVTLRHCYFRVDEQTILYGRANSPSCVSEIKMWMLMNSPPLLFLLTNELKSNELCGEYHISRRCWESTMKMQGRSIIILHLGSVFQNVFVTYVCNAENECEQTTCLVGGGDRQTITLSMDLQNTIL